MSRQRNDRSREGEDARDASKDFRFCKRGLLTTSTAVRVSDCRSYKDFAPSELFMHPV
jgi:hypothetical protein